MAVEKLFCALALWRVQRRGARNVRGQRDTTTHARLMQVLLHFLLLSNMTRDCPLANCNATEHNPTCPERFSGFGKTPVSPNGGISRTHCRAQSTDCVRHLNAKKVQVCRRYCTLLSSTNRSEFEISNASWMHAYGVFRNMAAELCSTEVQDASGTVLICHVAVP